MGITIELPEMIGIQNGSKREISIILYGVRE